MTKDSWPPRMNGSGKLLVTVLSTLIAAGIVANVVMYGDGRASAAETRSLQRQIDGMERRLIRLEVKLDRALKRSER